MILDLKVKLSKLNLKQLRIVLKEFNKTEIDEDSELEVVLAEEFLEYINMRIKKLEKKEND